MTCNYCGSDKKHKHDHCSQLPDREELVHEFMHDGYATLKSLSAKYKVPANAVKHKLIAFGVRPEILKDKSRIAVRQAKRDRRSTRVFCKVCGIDVAYVSHSSRKLCICGLCLQDSGAELGNVRMLDTERPSSDWAIKQMKSMIGDITAFNHRDWQTLDIIRLATADKDDDDVINWSLYVSE